MQYDVSNPQEYLEALDLDWRKEKLQELRDIILKQDSAIWETISYKMLCFKLNDSELFHLNAQRGYVSLYCGNTKKIDPEGELLKGLNIGKGCIRFTKTKDISKTSIESFINRAVLLVKEGIDIGC
ncbi:MAG: iron chaperone [Arenicella sp.]